MPLTDTASTTTSPSNTNSVVNPVTINPTSGPVGQTLSCSSDAEDADGQALTIYTWVNHDGTTIQAEETVTYGTGSTYSIAGADTQPEEEVVCRAVANDGEDDSTPVATASAEVTNTDPVVDSIEIVSSSGGSLGGEVQVDNTVECSVSASDADADADQLTYHYAWTSTSEGTILSGFGQDSYDVVKGDVDVGDTLTCTVDIQDPYGGTDTASASVTIDNTPPVLSSVTLSPATLCENADATCLPGTSSDADDNDIDFEYGWYVGPSGAGTLFAAETSDTLSSDDIGPTDSVYSCSYSL